MARMKLIIDIKNKKPASTVHTISNAKLSVEQLEFTQPVINVLIRVPIAKPSLGMDSSSNTMYATKNPSREASWPIPIVQTQMKK